jgi:hypothetical protein
MCLAAGVKTQPRQGSQWTQPNQRFWLLFSMQCGL